MKKLFLLSLFFLYAITFSQNQDLEKLVQGKYLGFNSISDNQKKLFGYLALYEIGKTSDNKKESILEYTLLDKNLNPIGSGKFETDKSATEYSTFLNSNNEIIIKASSNSYDGNWNSYYAPSDFIIGLKDYQITKKNQLYYDGSNLIALARAKTHATLKDDKKNLKKENGYRLFPKIVELENGKTIIYEEKYKKVYYDEVIKCFDENRQLLWDYNLRDKYKNATVIGFNIINYDKDILITKVATFGDASKEKRFVVFDINSGKVLFEGDIPFDTLLPEIESFIDGEINNKFNTDEKLTSLLAFPGSNIIINGFSKLTYDKKLNQLSLYSVNLWNINSFIKDIPELKAAYDPNDWDTKSINLLDSGETVVVSQKIDRKKLEFSDFIMMSYDSEMKLKSVQYIPAQKNSLFLYCQYLNDNEDLVFFYADMEKKNREKKWNLYINTFINEKFKQETLPMNSDKNLLIPYLAKEGYILLQEFNEKEQYNTIRLERLNY